MTRDSTEPAAGPAPDAAPPLPPDGADTPTVRRSRLLAAGVVVVGLLTILVGLVVFGIGIGFANATASGTGAGGMGVGLWMVLAARGVARRRLATFVGLSLAWGWLLARVVIDLPATAVSSIVVLFLISPVSVPIALVWALLVIVVGVVGLVRLVGAYRQWRQMPAEERPGLGWPAVGIGVRLALLVAATLLVPLAVWAQRGQAIADLAKQYAPPPGQPRRPTTFGACSVVFLGYELTHADPGPTATQEDRLAACGSRVADARADLASIVAAGARYVRMGASGDHLWGNDPARTAFQETLDDTYMADVHATGIPTVLVDTQHPQNLPRRLNWEEFCEFQSRRIEYYTRRYRPAVYLVVCEPMSYHHFALRSDATFSAQAWATQLSAMCRLVKSIAPATRTGICLLVMDDKRPEWDVWTRMKTLPELDILSVEIYGPEQFGQTVERLEEFGHPAETGKTFWIAETYNGWALCGDRRADHDVAWLHVARDFASVVRAEAVLVWTFGSFVRGGSFYDYCTGRLHRRWAADGGVSPVGQALGDLQPPARP